MWLRCVAVSVWVGPVVVVAIWWFPCHRLICYALSVPLRGVELQLCEVLLLVRNKIVAAAAATTAPNSSVLLHVRACIGHQHPAQQPIQ